MTASRVIRLTLPRLGETMEEARVTDWLKAPGEAFRRGDVLLEVETDKTVVEVPAMQDGTLVAHLVHPGEMVGLDQAIADVEVTGASPAAQVVTVAAAPAASVVAAPQPRNALSDQTSAGRPAASPRARRLARVTGVALDQVSGTGRRGRVSGADVLAAAQDGAEGMTTSHGAVAMRRVAAIGPARAPVVLLHGLFDEGRGWRGLPDRLARAGHPVLVPDLPGHGATAAVAVSADEAVEIMAQALLQALPEGPLRLVGHSLGAVIATGLAERLGARVERLVLIAPVGVGALVNPGFLRIMSHADTPAALARGMALLGDTVLSEAALAAELHRLRIRRSDVAPLAESIAIEGVQQIDICAALQRLTVPVTAMFGLRDRIVDWRDAANLPPRAAIHFVPDAGHLPQVGAPDLAARLIAGTDS